jgi:hypothetical protein
VTVRRRLIACAVLAAASALIGPRIVGLQSRSADAPFAYEPPEGFVPFKESAGELQGAKAWVFDDGSGAVRPRASEEAGAAAVRVVAHHSSREMSVEEVDLAKLANEMGKAFEDTCTWTHRRHELRTRPDGGRVGLIEGDCNREIELGQLGLPKQRIRSRKLQLMFPDDTGTSIVTASYPTDQAARWEPLFEATIAKSRGVSVRVPAPSGVVIAGWAAAGAVLGWLATAIAFRTNKKGEPPKKSDKARTRTDDKSKRDEATS